MTPSNPKATRLSKGALSPFEALSQKLDLLIDLTDAIVQYCQSDIPKHTPDIGQLMLQRGSLLESLESDLYQSLSDEEKQALQPYLAKLQLVDQQLGTLLSDHLAQLGEQVGICKQSRQIMQHYRTSPLHTGQTQSYQA